MDNPITKKDIAIAIGVETCEFGRGFAYCLGLFLAHEGRRQTKELGDDGATMWFNAASDHLYELRIPESLPTELQHQISVFQHKCLGFRLSLCTWEDVDKAIAEAKQFLLAWDYHNKIPTLLAKWD